MRYMLVRIVDYVSNPGGGVRFLIEMLKVLVRDHPEASFELVSHGVALERYRDLLDANGVGVKLVDIRPEKDWQKLCVRILMRVLWPLKIGGLRAEIGTRLVRRYHLVPKSLFDDCDVVWLPWRRDHRLTEPYACPVVATFHDVIGFQVEGAMHPDQLAEEAEMIRRWIASPARLVVGSRATASAVAELFGSPPDRFSVIPLSGEHAVAASTAHVLPAGWSWSNDPFLLYPANITPHKNHEVLLEGVAAWGAKHPLVLAGNGTDFPKPERRGMGLRNVPGLRKRGMDLRYLAETQGLEVGTSLILLGYVTDEVSYGLLARAWALVMPTLAEGGGSFPVWEAMLSGVPVVCSDIPVLREQVERTGGDVLWFNPRDPLDLARALQKLEENYEHHKVRAVNQVGELRHRSWRDVAGEYWDLIQRETTMAGSSIR